MKKIPSSIEELLRSKWGEMAKDPEKLDSLCASASRLLEKLGRKNPAAGKLALAVRLFKDARSRRELLGPRNILIIAAALLYTITPLDGIPDIIPVAGWLDDAGVLAMALSYILSTLPKNRKEPYGETSDEDSGKEDAQDWQ